MEDPVADECSGDLCPASAAAAGAAAAEVPCVSAVLLCCSLGLLYVGSLYVWRSGFSRDHPATIRRRFVSVLLVSLVSPLFPHLYLQYGPGRASPLADHSIWQVMGLRLSGLLPALLLPYLLTAVLFLGPLVQQYHVGHWNIYLEPMYWWQSLRNLVWVRNHIVAPFSEEFTFRACMVPMLATCMSPQQLYFCAPLFFGIAHLHHLMERLSQRQGVLNALAASLFQFAYTTVFGVYSAYLFVRTGHMTAPFMAHAFCNHMGFPDVTGLLAEPEPRRAKLVLAYVTGLVVWYLLLGALTTPAVYGNTVYYSAAV
ncbi:CAAX prenyl protease 2 [Amphibalanus amphitrite]|uniref:CAAX prenyl protease 2 n=1 Tax=Amphibalanus amphitrite TaxID=1232801 RepID=A0A6A4WXT2_AMPAM|nr:CAAX prenyl protease 2 [Amphibalanus amphitrite]